MRRWLGLLQLKILGRAGSKIIYAPHANVAGSTIAGWYQFRARWGGTWDGELVPLPTNNGGAEELMPSGGWISQLKLMAALHNHAAWYDPQWNLPTFDHKFDDQPACWASGSWFIGPQGQTWAQMPASEARSDCKEYILMHNLPLKS